MSCGRCVGCSALTARAKSVGFLEVASLPMRHCESSLLALICVIMIMQLYVAVLAAWP